MLSKSIVVCDNCGKEFEKYNYRITNHNFCSHRCFQIWQRSKNKLGKKRRLKLEKEKRRITICTYCGKTFQKQPSLIGNHNFCSQDCYFAWRRERDNWKGKIKKICKHCGKDFYTSSYISKEGDTRYNRTFCSLECKAKWQHENIVGARHHQWTKIERVCSVCGKTFYAKPSHIAKGEGIYCSLKCMGEARRLKKIKEWQDPQYREKTIRASLKGLFKRPTNLERQFISLAHQHKLPYKYTGDGSFLIGYKNPDFVNTNGAKICIEVANHYHHQGDWAEKRIRHFKNYGWNCLIFFTKGKELDKQEVLARLGVEV